MEIMKMCGMSTNAMSVLITVRLGLENNIIGKIH